MTCFADLLTILSNLPKGKIARAHVPDIERQLAECWGELSVLEGGMQGYKIVGRLERLEWQSPTLVFDIERHGAIVAGGSSRAEVQRWQVDLANRNACLVASRVRQITPRDAVVKTRNIAQEIAELIRDFATDDRLIWKDKTSVSVNIGRVIATSNKATTAGRRKRFAIDLEKELVSSGWQKRLRSNRLVFERLS